MDVTPDAELAAVAAAWDRAMVSNDPETIGHFMAEDWLIVGSDGGTTDKPTFLEQVRSGRLTHDTMTTADIQVRRYGDVAVLMATGVSAGMFQGRRFQEHERQSNVFVRTKGNWRCVLTHLSRLVMRSLILFMVMTGAVACADDDGLDDDDRREVSAAVDSAVRSFEAAQRSLNADQAVSLMAPEFAMYTDGVKQGRDSVAAGIRRSFGMTRHLDPGFADIQIIPLSETSALSSFRFRDSLVTADGKSLRFAGATTLLWELRDGRWLMTYGHADHHPVP